TKPQENKERSLSPDLSSVEKFLILYQNIVPEIEEINEEKVKKALEELLQLEYTASGKQVKAAQMRIIRAIRYEPAIVESEERDKKKEEIIDVGKRCNRRRKDCTCQCRKHGYILDCGIEHDEECYYITIEEYEEYQKKSSIFQTLVKIGTYKWNGETYEMVNKTKEHEESEEEKENKGKKEKQRGNKNDDEFEYEEYEEKYIKRPEISSPFQYSENSENDSFQNIITPEKSNTTTNTNTGTNTPSTQGSFNRLFSNPQTPPQ